MHDAKVMARNADMTRQLQADPDADSIVTYAKTPEGGVWEKLLTWRRDIERKLPALVTAAGFDPKTRLPKEA